MHKKAKEWNIANYPALNGATPKGLVPYDRPCDWCGEIVDIGFIHDGECKKKEQDFWLEVFN